MPHGLLTDLYELTMSAGYAAAGKHRDRATFELFVRRLPAGRDYLIAAGLEQAVEYLLGLDFSHDEIEYLRTLPQFAHAPAEFWELLREFRFTGDVWAMPEGTPAFAGEPLMIVRGPLCEAQIPETYLLAMISFQTLIASKASRVAEAAAGRSTVEFGTRRAHSPEAGTLAARAAYVGGCAGTSNAEAGYRYGIPVYGTTAHSWIQSFDTERESFARLQQLLGEGTVYLIDTYDTLEGARRAAALGRPLWGVRLDSGDLGELARGVRKILDDAGLADAKIMASGDLNETKIAALVAAGAPIDSFGVGTELAASVDAPALGAVYKLAEIEHAGVKHGVIKLSPGKETYPGPKQVFRYRDRDVIAAIDECVGCDGAGETPVPLLRPVVRGGRLVEPLPKLAQVRDSAREQLAQIPRQWPRRVEYSERLRSAQVEVRGKWAGRG
ncbi:MAG: nicotinate phosphoribosyltransferase [Bryobacteraceae bacterium]